MPLGHRKLFEFGRFRLDAEQRLLLRDGEVVPLAPKALDTLLALVESQGAVLQKEDVIKKVWPDTFVEEGSLAQNISILRKVLGDGMNGEPYIQTIPKRGYRFVIPLAAASSDGDEPKGLPAPPPARRWPIKRVLAGAAALVAVLIALGTPVWHRSRTPMTAEDVLVLADFRNSTGEPVFDGTLREALAIRLEESPFLKVMSDVEMRQDLRLMGRSPGEHITNEIAREVCVREGEKAMISGSIAPLGKAYAITVEASACESGEALARGQAEAEDKEHVLKALAKLGNEIRLKLGESLSSIRRLSTYKEARQATTPSLEAFQAYAQGMEQDGLGNIILAHRSFERAIELDPSFASAYLMLGSGYPNEGLYIIRSMRRKHSP